MPYITPDGMYHLGDRQEGDVEVQPRPSSYHNFIDDAWVFDREDWLNKVLRPKRNEHLNYCDTVYCNADKWETMTEEQKTAWRTYKQALKDFPPDIAQPTEDFKDAVNWPEIPQ